MKVLLRNPRRELEVQGPMTVAKLLARLELNPESVLVIQGDTLVPKDARLVDSDTIEIRPVISGGAGVKCTRCKAPAVIDIRRHNAAFCSDCFVHHCQEQVRKAIHEHTMFEPDARILVAVSGGKDSLALWDLLVDLGYDADGVYLGLGIGEYSGESGHYVRDFALARGLKLHEVDIPSDHGFTIPGVAQVTRRSPCGACGLSKRHLFNSTALEHGYDVVATGHNLDDEAAVLLGNVLRWETGYLGRQYPVLPAEAGFARKVKPLVRMGEREMAAYCVIRGIDYQVEECPMAEGNRHLGFKEVLNALEDKSPGSKAAFLNGFFARGHERFQTESDEVELAPCPRCGAPTTTGGACAFCSLQARATGQPPIVVPVELRAGG